MTCGQREPILQPAEINHLPDGFQCPLSLPGNKVEDVCENLLVCNNNKLSLHKVAVYFVAMFQRIGDDKI